jgi:hypothetical protein
MRHATLQQQGGRAEVALFDLHAERGELRVWAANELGQLEMRAMRGEWAADGLGGGAVNWRMAREAIGACMAAAAAMALALVVFVAILGVFGVAIGVFIRAASWVIGQ